MTVTIKEIFVPQFKENYKFFFLIFLLYLYLFQPPLISKYVYITFEALVLIGYIIIPRKNKLTLPIKTFTNEFLIISIICIYALLRDLIAGEIVYSDRFLAWFFQSFIFSIFIISLIKKHNQNKSNKIDIVTLFYWTSFLAAIFTLLLIINKSFDSFYQSIEITNEAERYSTFNMRYRVYGIAENLTFTYSYILGFFAGYTLLVIKKNYFLIIPFLVFMIGIVFNARIGLFAVFMFALFITQKKYFLNLLVVLGLGILVIIIVSFQFPIFWEIVIGNMKWSLQSLYDVAYYITGIDYLKPESSNLALLTGKMLIYPETLLQWIFGSGESLFSGVKGNHSDVGYIIQLYYGGIIFLSLILLMMFYFCYRLYLVLGLTHWYFILFAFSLFLLNMKGFIFAATPGARLLFFLYCYYLHSSIKARNFQPVEPHDCIA